MSKINIKAILAVALGLNVFNYIGVLTIQWAWMHQQDFVNEYLPWISFWNLTLGTFIFRFLTFILPIVFLIIALAFSTKKKISLLFTGLALGSTLIAIISCFFYLKFSENVGYSWGQSFANTFRYQFLAFTSFTLPLDIFSMLINLLSMASIAFAIVLLFKNTESSPISDPLSTANATPVAFTNVQPQATVPVTPNKEYKMENTSANQWIVKMPGQPENSVDTATLQMWARSGVIRPDTLIVETASGMSYAASQIPGVYSSKSYVTALLLSFFLGYLGIDRFYLGQTGLGIGKLLTFGGCGIWALIDFILIAMRKVNDSQGNPLA